MLLLGSLGSQLSTIVTHCTLASQALIRRVVGYRAFPHQVFTHQSLAHRTFGC